MPRPASPIRSEKARVIELAIRVDSSDDDGAPLKASRPWLAIDGESFVPVPDSAWNRDGIDGVARFEMPAGRLVIAGWKPVTLESVNAWIDGIAKLPFVREQSIGLSREGRPLRQLEIGEGVKKRCVVVLGGQHPPEITGNHGLEAFVGEICADHETASRFRQAFRTIVIPMINPDGKHHGHWRCTTGGKDPNRDWFDQSQPEVRAVARHLARATAAGGEVCFGIDFHSTSRDFVYVESPAAGEQVAAFTRRWCERAEGLLDGVKLLREPGRSMNPCSREWMAANLKCPAYTREFRYDQDEDEVRRKARAEARAMMELLLD
jgi:murein tripeptide amidase MpaA